jgi:pimeloyl-ACP methyl ester carboxylesterase
MLDSSLGWVSNGVVGSQAFAAFDQGYDVYLGNLRGLASREHVKTNISPQEYWDFSLNEHGTQDISAMVTKIHELKMLELQAASGLNRESSLNGESGLNGEISEGTVDHDPKELPYRLCGVAHSMGGAAMIVYVVTRRLANRPHYLSRLILLSPAGFHDDCPFTIKLCTHVVPLIASYVCLVMPGIYIPTRFFRGLFNKLSRDFQNYPALGGLAQALVSYLIGGDSSNWIGAIGVSHYNMNNMPGLAVKVAVHFCQMIRAKRFLLYDYGSKELNMRAYGTTSPLDIGANYNVIDIPVDVVAGRNDRLIPSSMVKRHFDTMEAAGCQASFSEFEFAHLDFTFANREELMAYVTSRLSLVAPIPGNIIEPLAETPSSRHLTGVLSSRNGEIVPKKPEESSSSSGSRVKPTSKVITTLRTLGRTFSFLVFKCRTS